MPLTDNEISAIIGALVGGLVAALSQFVFYLFAIRRENEVGRRAFAKQQLDEFYSPMLTRLLEIEYKHWLDLEARKLIEKDKKHHEDEYGELGDRHQKLRKLIEYSESQLAREVEALDEELIHLFRRKRWLAFDSTVRHCQELIKFSEAKRLAQAVEIGEIMEDWGDVRKLHPLHTDVRLHHDDLMQKLGGRKQASRSLITEGETSAAGHEKVALEKYVENMINRQTKE
jgi:hypothetical protein